MRRFSLTTTIALSLAAVTTVVIITAGIIFSFASFYLIERDFKSNLIEQTQDLAAQHLIAQDGLIYFKRDAQGVSLTNKLRVKDLSAVLFDRELAPISKFGIFFADRQDQSQLYQNVRMNTVNVRQTGQPQVTHSAAADGVIYELFTAPVNSSGSAIGYLTVARQEHFVGRIVQVNLLILLFIIPIGILLSWFLSFKVTKKALTPLLSLIAHIHSLSVDNQMQPLETVDSIGDEITKLTDAYNTMLTRIGMGITKQKQFIGNASHELKTPLARLASTLDVALFDLEKKDFTAAKEKLKRLQQSVIELGHLTDSLLLLSKISDRNPPDPANTNLRHLAENTVRKLADLISAKNISVVIDIPARQSLYINHDYAVILFKNLIENAVKYNKTGGSISIIARPENGKSVVAVSDTGVGIDSQNLKQIFDRFYRHPQTASLAEGYGLGMAIVKEIADLYGIQITVRSRKNQGTTFTLSQAVAESHLD